MLTAGRHHLGARPALAPGGLPVGPGAPTYGRPDRTGPVRTGSPAASSGQGDLVGAQLPQVQAIAVVVPAHDEQALLPACVAALRRAAQHPGVRHLPIHLITVLDSCSDDSGAVAPPGALEISAHNVGVARAAGFAAAIAREAGRPSSGLWLATTDADSTVPVDWLAEQLRLAALGAEVVAGTVAVPDWSQQPQAVRRRFLRSYGAPGTGHLHVHGANLGMSGAAYLDAGGVPPLALAEDQALVDALRGRARRLVATGRIPVLTSGRRESRIVAGFADHLRALSKAEAPTR